MATYTKEQAEELLEFYGSVGSYIARDRKNVCEAIRNNPVYNIKIELQAEEFCVIGGSKACDVEGLAKEAVVFCQEQLQKLKAYRDDESKTRELLDVMFWGFPVKRDTTLDGSREKRAYFIGLLRDKGFTDDEIVTWVNSLPGCCASIVENILFTHISIDYTFRHAYNHLRVCRNCRGTIVDYELLEVDEGRLKVLIDKEALKGEEPNIILKRECIEVIPQISSFSLKPKFYKQGTVFVEQLYSLLCENNIQYISDKTDIETFKAVLLTRDHVKEVKCIHWLCDTREVYYITKKLMDYIDGLTFEHFGKLCVSKRGTKLKFLCASKTDDPRRKEDIDSIFYKLNDFLQKD